MRKSVLIVTWFAAALSAQTPVAECRACDHTGLVPCARHGKVLALEKAAHVLHCSEAFTCKACGGALAVDCKACSAPAIEAQLAERRQLAQQWLERRRQDAGDSVQKEPFRHLETSHFDVVSALKPANIGREKVDAHQRLHLYGERLEALRSMFLEVLKLSPSDLPDRQRVYMFDDARDHAVIGPRVTGLGTANSVGLKLMGPEYVYSMWNDRRSLPDDEAVHRNIVHNVTHLLLSQMPPAAFLGNRKHGWIDEGVAHWFEDRVVGRCTNFCFEEVLLQPGSGFKGGHWRPAVRRLIDEGKGPSFALLSTLNTDELTFEQHAFAFAWVDYFLVEHGGAKFRDFLRLIKKGQPTREALAAVYAASPLNVDSRFQTWVKANYSPVVVR